MKEERRKENDKRCANRSVLLPSLRELRQNRGLSQRDLGRLAQVSPGTIFRLEGELRGAYPATVRKLASALGVEPVDLIRGLRRE